MPDVKPSGYIIGIIMFTFIIVGGMSVISLMYNDDPSHFDSSKITQFNSTFNKMGEITNQVNSMQTNIEGTPTYDWNDYFGRWLRKIQ